MFAVNPAVKSRAEALADALAESDEYQAYQDARAELDQHEAAKIMLRDFQSKQASLQQKVMAGQQPTEEEMQKLQQAYQVVAFNPYVRKVIEAEAAFSEMLTEVQKMLAEAVGIEVPEEAGDGDEASPEQTAGSGPTEGQGAGAKRKPDDDGGSARGRLWVPGR